MARDVVFEEDAPRKVQNAWSEPIRLLIETLKDGKPQRMRIPVETDEDRKSILRKCRDAANAQGYSAGERKPDDDDTSGDLLIGVREKISRPTAAKPAA